MSGHLLRTAFLSLSLFILNATATAETLVPIMVDDIIIFVPAVTPTPEVPTLTLPSSDSDGTYTISWSDVFGATNYQMEGELSGVLYDGPALSTSRSKPNGSYNYKVKACNSSGCSAYSATKTIVVGAASPIPSTPSLSAPTTDSDGSYTISWSSVTHATNYQLEGELSGLLYSGSSLSASRSKPNGSYGYKVKACNSSGCSAYSAVKTVVVDIPTTTPPGPETPETTPINVAATTAPTLAAVPAEDKTSTAIGTLSGTFKVDESGAATYNVPLALPLGISGIAPAISLNYHSGAGNGAMGVGWRLSGLSSITRCRQTTEQDDNIKALTLTNSDRFCLDGQKLVLVSGSYGANGAQYRTEIDSQRRITSYSSSYGPSYFLVEAADGSRSYYGKTANSTLKNGAVSVNWLVSQINDNMNNSINFAYDNNSYGSNEVLIDNISYSGHTVSFSYNSNTALGQRQDTNQGYHQGLLVERTARLDAVEISHQTGASQRYVLDYQQDSTSELTQLTGIQHCAGSGSSQVCQTKTEFDWLPLYNHFWYPTTHTSDDPIAAVVPADIDGNGVTDLVTMTTRDNKNYKIKVEYNQRPRSTSFTAPTQIYSFYSTKSVTLRAVDVDSDGKVELVFNKEDRWYYFDFNNSITRSVRIDRYGEPELVEIEQRVFALAGLTKTEVGSAKNLLFFDTDGDALTDLVYKKTLTNKYSGNTIAVIKSLGQDSQGQVQWAATSTVPITGFTPRDVNIPVGYYHDTGYHTVATGSGIYDFNNDGIADLLLTSRDTLTSEDEECEEDQGGYPMCGPADEYDDSYLIAFVLVDGEYQFFGYAGESYRDYSSGLQFDKNYTVADINADGYSDVLYQGSTPTTSRGWHIKYGTGSGFSNPVKVPISEGQYIYISRPVISDMNGDGQPDIVFFYNTDDTWYVSYQDNGVFSTQQKLVGPFSDHGIYDSTFTAPLAGDNIIDFIRIDSDAKQVKLYINRDNRFMPSNMIGTIRNGFGNETKINYERLNNPDIYTKGENAETLNYGNGSPVFDMTGPSYVVSSATAAAPGYVNGSYNANNKVSVSYQYQGMRLQSGGRGGLGFAKLTTHVPLKNVTSQTVYHQDFPYAGMPKATISYLGSPQATALNADGTTTIIASQRLKYSQNSYGLHQLHSNSVYFPYLHVSTETNYSLNDAGTATGHISTVVTTNNYEVNSDNHANLKTVTVVSKNASGSEVARVTTSNTYSSDNVTNWWLGRVNQASVVHSRADDYPNANITRATQFTYYDNSSDFGGMLKEEIIAPGSSKQLTTLHCYDSFGNQQQLISHANVGSVDCHSKNRLTAANLTDTSQIFRRQVSTFDAQGRAISQQGNDQFANLKTINNRNTLGQPTQSTDISGMVSKVGYDSFGAQYFASNNTGQSSNSKRSYSNPGPAIGESYKFTETVTAAGLGTTIKYFDALGREVATAEQGFADSSWIIQQTRYDPIGRAVQTSMPHYAGASVYWSNTSYDRFGRIQSITAADGPVSSVTYNGLSVQTHVTFDTPNQGQQSQTKTEVKNIHGETTSVTDNAGTIRYYYKASGNLTKVTGVDGVNIITGYNSWGLKTSMDDPNKGDWLYDHNALGEMVSQTSPNGFVTTYYRDDLGRTVERNVSGSGVNESTNYHYGTSHLLQSEDFSDGSGQAKVYYYDNFGRVIRVNTTTANDAIYNRSTTYAQQTVFDRYGRIFQQFDADASSTVGCKVGNNISGACWGIQNSYNARGFLISQKEARNGASSDAKEYYRVTAMDALGNITSFSQNNNKVSSIKSYNQANGQLSNLTASRGSLNLQDNDYTFDGLGNLRSRTRNSLKTGALGQSESFLYDNLNRLTHINNLEQTRYSANGNIRWKRDLGYYCYNAAKPHAVSGIGSSGCTTQSYQYDANGNMTSGRNRTIGYSHFDKPLSINSSDGDVTNFAYGTNRKRFKRVTREKVDGVDVTTTTYTIGNVEIERKSNSSVIVTRRNLPGAIELQRDNGSSEINFLHKDHLGSIDTITDVDGNIKQVLYFDAWGKKSLIASNNMVVSLQGFTTLSLNQLLEISNRGFTGHETIDHAEIIHMNGRIYDPTLGRFLQADPLIQSPKHSQSLNRYSYVINNPLSLTDPSGFSFLSKIWKKIRPFIGIIVTVLVSIYCQACGPVVAGMLGGAAGAAANGGNILQGALFGAFTAGAGQYGTLAAALAGGIVSKVQGGKFGRGFVSAGLGAAIGGGMGKGWGRVVTAAVVGGSISKISGGKFANGAISSAFSAAVAMSTAGKVQKADPNDTKYAEMADAVYDLTKAHEGSTEIVEGFTMEELFIDNDTGMKAALFTNDDGAVLAFAGTSATSGADWKANLLQSMGLPSGQHTKAFDRAQAVYDDYGGKVHFTGHSLGGGIAAAAAIRTGGSATVFNAAGVHSASLGGKPRSNGSVRYYYSSNDALRIINLLTPASVPGEQINLGGAGLHGMGGMCENMGCKPWDKPQ